VLAAYFLSKKSKELGIHPIPTMTAETLQRLARHPWPGNVRELENAVERALIQHRRGPLSFHPVIQAPMVTDPPFSAVAGRPLLTLDEAMRRHITTALETARGKVSGPGGAAAALDVHPNTLRNRMKKLGIAFGRKRMRGS
jgi:hydrogenase-4 transcriptional activator